MTDHNEIRRKECYAETQTECRQLLGSIYLALVDHEARAKDWGANGTLLSTKCSLGQILEVLAPEVVTEAQIIEEAAKRG
jgi:hypothetical protein